MPAGQSGIPLARVDIPANTGTITASMIKDLRFLAQPRFKGDIDVQPCNSGDVKLTDTNWFNWPTNAYTVQVPRWATHAVVVVHWTTIVVTGAADVNTRVQFGPLTGGQISYFDYNGNTGTPVGYVENRAHVAADEFDVRALQGMAVQVRTNARRTFETVNKGDVYVTSADKLVYDVRFFERTV